MSLATKYVEVEIAQHKGEAGNVFKRTKDTLYLIKVILKQQIRMYTKHDIFSTVYLTIKAHYSQK